MAAKHRAKLDLKWCPEQIQSQLLPLSISTTADLPEAVKEYKQYYGLDFENRYQSVDYKIGKLELAGFTISSQLFQVPDAKGTVLIVHGYYDHVGLYRHIIQHCLDQGFNVFAFDLPGHGLSSGELASIQSFRQYDDVFSSMVQWLQENIDSPIVVMGQSTGGAIIINYLLTRGLNRSTSPFAKIYLLAPLVRPVNWIASKYFYYLARPFVKQLRREFAQNSHDREFLSFISQRDPLQPLFLKTQWVGALKKWIRFIEAAKPVDLDIHIIQGTEDGTVDYRHNMLVLEKKFSGFNVTFVEQGRHHLANEEASKLQQVITAMTPVL